MYIYYHAYFLRHQGLRSLYKKCILLNGVFILSTIYLYEAILFPIFLHFAHNFLQKFNPIPLERFILENLMSSLYAILWLMPMLSLALLINSVWYSQMAIMISSKIDSSSKLKRTLNDITARRQEDIELSNNRSAGFVKSSSQRIYRVLFILILSAQLIVLQKISSILSHLALTVLCHALTSLFYAFYCFEYRNFFVILF
jgi:Etoposide-induced protein 2.4 (EI24)